MINATPDIQFKTHLRKISNAPLNECIQCGTCSVVCTLAPDDRPFPRKEMIWAGWGMKEQLIGNPDVWLCHQCGDCSTYCPRDVKPADVLSAVRQLSYGHYARPKFLGKLLGSPKGLPIAILIPVIVITTILLLAGTLTIPEGPVDYSKFFPHSWLNSSFSTLTFIIIGFTIGGLLKFWKDMRNKFPVEEYRMGFIAGIFGVIGELITHKNFGSCEEQKPRKLAHLLVFYGFILLFLMTIYAMYAVVMDIYPLSFSNPFKILGNVASLMLISGLIIMIVNRIRYKEKFGNSNYSDWLFLISMLILTISGVLVEMGRFLDWQIAYHIYFLHLCTVWFMIIYLPYIKFGHILYRTTAMVFARMIGRK